jgi:hypothetical protein
MADIAIPSLPAGSTLTADDLLVVENSPGSGPVTQKYTLAQLQAFVLDLIVSAGANGRIGLSDTTQAWGLDVRGTLADQFIIRDVSASIDILTLLKGAATTPVNRARVGIGVANPDPGVTLYLADADDCQLKVNSTTPGYSNTILSTGFQINRPDGGNCTLDVTNANGDFLFRFNNPAVEKARVSKEGNLTLAGIATIDTQAILRKVAGAAAALVFDWMQNAASGKYNWRIGAQINVDNGFEITPSTAVDGSTFATPVFQVTQAGAANVAASLAVAGTKVVGAQGAAVADATDAASAITQLNLLLARCRAHGLIAT